MKAVEYKVELVDIDFEKAKWYDSHKELDEFSLRHSLEGLLNEYAGLGYTLASITPLTNTVTSNSITSNRTISLIVTFQKEVLT